MSESIRNRSMKISTIINVSLLVAAVFLSLAYLFRNVLAGDSIIHLIYGRNLAHGRFMQFNANELSFGSSSLIWTAISAIPYVFQSDDYTAIYIQKALSISVFLVCAIWLGRSKFFQLGKTEYVVLVAYWLGLSKFIQFATVGMETPLAILLLLLVINNTYNLLKWIENIWKTSRIDFRPLQSGRLSGTARFLAGGVCSGLLILTRLELAIVAILVIAFLLMSSLYWRNMNPGGSASGIGDTVRVLRPLGLYVLGMAITVAPYLGYMYYHTGSFVSSSAISRLYLARNQLNSAIHLAGSIYLNTKLVVFLLVNFSLLIAAAVALAAALKPGILHSDSTSGMVPENILQRNAPLSARAFTTVLCICIILALGFYFLLVFPGFQGARYFMPVLALIVVWAAKGVVVISKLLGGRLRLSPKLVGSCLVGFGLLSHGVFNQLYTPMVFQRPDRVSYAEIARFISSHIPVGKSILAYEVQVKIHLPNHRIIAEDGVTDGIVLRYYEKYPDPAQAIEHFLLDVRPDFVIAGYPRKGQTPRIKDTLLGKLQTLAREETLPGQPIWLSGRIGATEIYKAPDLEKLYQMTYR